jgi:hypothetical protein
MNSSKFYDSAVFYIFAADISYAMSSLVLVSVCYKDGVMENEPKPCAAVKGTQVMVSLT